MLKCFISLHNGVYILCFPVWLIVMCGKVEECFPLRYSTEGFRLLNFDCFSNWTSIYYTERHRHTYSNAHSVQDAERKTHRQMTPSLDEKIQHGWLICLGSEHSPCFSCLIILGCNFQTIWLMPHIDRAITKVLNFTIISQYYGVWMWGMRHCSDQSAGWYMRFWDVKISFQSGSFLHGVKGSSWTSRYVVVGDTKF